MCDVQKTAYSKAYTQRRSLALLASVLAADFETAVMLAFRYSGAAIVPAVAVSQILALRVQARRIAGGLFRYVQVNQLFRPPAEPTVQRRLLRRLAALLESRVLPGGFG